MKTPVGSKIIVNGQQLEISFSKPATTLFLTKMCNNALNKFCHAPGDKMFMFRKKSMYYFMGSLNVILDAEPDTACHIF